MLTDRNRLDIALYAYARSIVSVDALFYASAAAAGLFREDVRDRQSGRKRSVVKRNLSSIDRELLTDRNRLDIALYAFARSLVKVDALFYSKAAEAGLFREDVRDPKRAFCGGGGEWMERSYGKDGQLVSSHVVTPDGVVGEDEEGDLEFLEEE